MPLRQLLTIQYVIFTNTILRMMKCKKYENKIIRRQSLNIVPRWLRRHNTNLYYMLTTYWN